jgi:hypothetical protein
MRQMKRPREAAETVRTLTGAEQEQMRVSGVPALAAARGWRGGEDAAEGERSRGEAEEDEDSTGGGGCEDLDPTGTKTHP